MLADAPRAGSGVCSGRITSRSSACDGGSTDSSTVSTGPVGTGGRETTVSTDSGSGRCAPASVLLPQAWVSWASADCSRGRRGTCWSVLRSHSVDESVVPGSPVVHLERVRTADGEPMALERTHLPAQRLPGLESADLRDASLYELLERRWGVRVAQADQWASVVRLTAEEAALLQVAPDQPALLFQRLTRDPSGAPIEYVRSLYRGDRYEVHTRLERLDA